MDSPNSRRHICVGCGSEITDQYVLRVAPDLEWHASCLKCADCHQTLDENCTCFVRDGKTYCKDDYIRLFGTKCAKCGLRFAKNDLVMRAKTKIYHLDCFSCSVCGRQLVPGDEFALRAAGLLCKADHEATNDRNNYDYINTTTTTTTTTTADQHEDITRTESNNNDDSKLVSTDSTSSHGSSSPIMHHGPRNGSGSVGNFHHHHHHHHHHGRTGSGRGGHQKGEQKTTRIRTVLNEKQLHTLRTCYSANSRPDALMKEQLVEMTGLSPRVIRVWFQNKRCKDKKRSIVLKQLQQQNKGIPLIATSPVRHEPPTSLQASPVEVEKYPAPWSDLSELQAIQMEMEKQTTPFQQLINSFGDSFDDDTVVSFDDLSEAPGAPGVNGATGAAGRLAQAPGPHLHSPRLGGLPPGLHSITPGYIINGHY